MEKLRSIQVLRGVAALGVVLMHAGSSPINPDKLWVFVGGAGVDLFFVISGFIMATIGSNKAAGQFLAARFWRIYPVWIVAALPWLLFTSPDWQTAVATVTLWPIFDTFTNPALGIGWTLSFEMLFYLGFALALKTRPWVPLAIFGACVFSPVPLRDFLGSPMILEFLAGVAIAYLPRNERIGLPLAIVGCVILALAPLGLFMREFAVSAESAIPRAAIVGTAAALIVYGVLSSERIFTSRAWDMPVLLGNASYSIYLVHLGPLLLLDLPWLIEFATAVIAGVLFWRVIEQPITKTLPARLLSRGRSNDHDGLIVARTGA